MGKRKSSKKPQAKKGPPPLSTTFDCIICNGSNTIHISVDRKSQRANLVCKECGVDWYRPAKPRGMDEPVDVYYDWVDEAEKARLLAEDKRNRKAARHLPVPRLSVTPDPMAHGSGGGATYHYDNPSPSSSADGGEAMGLPHGVTAQGRARGGKVARARDPDDSDEEDAGGANDRERESERERPASKKARTAAPIEYEEEESD